MGGRCPPYTITIKGWGEPMNIPNVIKEFAVNAKKAARPLGNLSRGVKDQVLLRMAALFKERQAQHPGGER